MTAALEGYVCPKCGSLDASVSPVRVTEGLLGALLNWQTAVFTAVSCSGCSYTDFYRR
jgi:uncharacterized protein